MSKYIVLTEIKTEAREAEWWMEQTDDTTEIKCFEDFETAKTYMRENVKKLSTSCKFFPYKRQKFQLLYSGSDVKRIIEKTIAEPDYCCDEADNLDVEDVDYADWRSATVANSEAIVIISGDEAFRMNIHNMKKEADNYYFVYEQTDENGSVINSLSVKLYKIGITGNKKEKKTEVKNYKTINFGKYPQDKAGKKMSDISWRVLTEQDGYALIMSELVIDHLQFSEKGDSSWKSSDLRAWLNDSFLNIAFDENEKMKIEEVQPGEKVFLLSVDEIEEYLPKFEDRKAKYTEYSRKKASEHYGKSIREPYAFWWLRTQNENDKRYLYHVCNSGWLNAYEGADYFDGVRPACWIKTENI